MLVRVLEIPPTRGEFCFGGGVPQLWLEVDWFTTDGCPEGDAVPPEDIMEFVKKKRYATPGRPLLILSRAVGEDVVLRGEPEMSRWPIIRHIRWLYLDWQVRRWARMWAQHGIGLGHVNPSDRAYLDAVWRGEE
jgi:hypothetical protein